MIASNFYEGHVRARVCGLIISECKILLVVHKLKGKPFYSPPGGGVKFGENMMDALKREFIEETGLIIERAKFQFVTEYVNPPLHAIELFFSVPNYKGEVITGNEPEAPEIKLITEVNWFTIEDLEKIPNAYKHDILKNCTHLNQLSKLNGFINKFI